MKLASQPATKPISKNKTTSITICPPCQFGVVYFPWSYGVKIESSRSNIWRLHRMIGLLSSRLRKKQQAVSALGETRPNLGIIAVWQDGYQPGLRPLWSATD